jgi:hypothetical protein
MAKWQSYVRRLSRGTSWFLCRVAELLVRRESSCPEEEGLWVFGFEKIESVSSPESAAENRHRDVLHLLRVTMERRHPERLPGGRPERSSISSLAVVFALSSSPEPSEPGGKTGNGDHMYTMLYLYVQNGA